MSADRFCNLSSNGIDRTTIRETDFEFRRLSLFEAEGGVGLCPLPLPKLHARLLGFRGKQLAASAGRRKRNSGAGGDEHGAPPPKKKKVGGRGNGWVWQNHQARKDFCGTRGNVLPGQLATHVLFLDDVRKKRFTVFFVSVTHFKLSFSSLSFSRRPALLPQLPPRPRRRPHQRRKVLHGAHR